MIGLFKLCAQTGPLRLSSKPLTKESCQLAVEDGEPNLKQLVSSLRGPSHGLLHAHCRLSFCRLEASEIVGFRSAEKHFRQSISPK